MTLCRASWRQVWNTTNISVPLINAVICYDYGLDVGDRLVSMTNWWDSADIGNPKYPEEIFSQCHFPFTTAKLLFILKKKKAS